MANKVTIYTTETCGYCRMLKNFLDDNKIKYSEKHVDKDAQAAQEMVGLSGQMGVPFTVVEDGKGQKRGILGFDVTNLKDALAI